MPILSKAIAGAIGLGSEYRAQKARKSSPSPSPNPQTESDELGHLSSDNDEAHWELDDAQHETGDTPDAANVDELIQNFQKQHPPPPYSESNKLPAPVILPQSRPSHKDRGFVRAYAPDLMACGIDQKTWFDFLDGFHKAIKMNPVFHAANVAVLGGAIGLSAVAGPSMIAHAVAFALHLSVEASRHTFIQFETNKYLDAMNQDLFRPHGLYAMIMMYKPNSKDSVTEVNSAEQKTMEGISSRYDGHGGRFSSASATTRSDLEIPEVATLVYPKLDSLPDDEKKSKMTRGKEFLRDYYDRQAQAKFDEQNPGSKLSAPRDEFASAYSDPNHPANSGTLLALATKGKVQGPLSRIRGRRQNKGKAGIKKKILKQNVLYLMVVNMPSEEELQAATAQPPT